MRRTILLAISVLTFTMNAATALAAPPPKFNPTKEYYLALGDSFSFGYQVTRLGSPPDAAAFDHGFVDRLGVYLRSIEPTITTVNYGCPGESTVTFIQGGCPWTALGYPLHDGFAGTQLAAAVAFLRAHPGEVSPITISLVLNDVQRFIADCVWGAFIRIARFTCPFGQAWVGCRGGLTGPSGMPSRPALLGAKT